MSRFQENDQDLSRGITEGIGDNPDVLLKRASSTISSCTNLDIQYTSHPASPHDHTRGFSQDCRQQYSFCANGKREATLVP